jgi:hypothetical protein
MPPPAPHFGGGLFGTESAKHLEEAGSLSKNAAESS